MATKKSSKTRPEPPDPKDPKDRKERIVHAALELFSTQGVQQTRLGEIAQKAKLDQPLINYYFPTLESLYAEVVDRVLDDLRSWVLKIPPGEALPFLLKYARATVEWAAKKPEYFSIFMYFYYLATHSPRFSAINHEIRNVGRERIAALLYRALEQGTIRPPKGQKVEELALVIQGIITGMAILTFTEGQPRAWEAQADAMEATIRSLLNTTSGGRRKQ